MVRHQLRLLNTYFLCPGVRLILEPEKWVELQEWIMDLSGLFLFLGTGKKKSLSTRDLIGSLRKI